MAATTVVSSTALQSAIRADDYAEVARCLATGANPNADSTEPSAELHRGYPVTSAPLLIHVRSQDILEVMLSYGADASARFTNGSYTTISQFFQHHADASRKALFSCLSALMNAGAQRDAELVRLRAKHHQSVCVLAMDLSLNGVERMLALGANPLALDGANRNALDCVFASAEPSSTLAHRILDTLLVAAQRHLTPERFSTALHLFAAYGSVDAVEAALDDGESPIAPNSAFALPADLAGPSGRDGDAKARMLFNAMRVTMERGLVAAPGPGLALHAAIGANCFGVPLLRAAIHAGCDLNAQLPNGTTLLHTAAAAGQAYTVAALLGMGADRHVVDRSGVPAGASDTKTREFLLDTRPLPEHFASLRRAGASSSAAGGSADSVVVAQLVELARSQQAQLAAQQAAMDRMLAQHERVVFDLLARVTALERR